MIFVSCIIIIIVITASTADSCVNFLDDAMLVYRYIALGGADWYMLSQHLV